MLLVIEVAISSLSTDHVAKAAFYARHGIGEYWVVDVTTLETTVYRLPDATWYQDVTQFRRVSALTATRLPGLTVTMAGFGASSKISPEGCSALAQAVRQADSMEAGIHVDHFGRGGPAQIAQQPQRRPGDTFH